MMERGIRADVDGLKLERQRMMDKANELQEELNFLAGRPRNPNSPKQLRDYFYIEKGLTPYRKGGKPTTNVDALKRVTPISRSCSLKPVLAQDR